MSGRAQFYVFVFAPLMLLAVLTGSLFIVLALTAGALLGEALL